VVPVQVLRPCTPGGRTRRLLGHPWTAGPFRLPGDLTAVAWARRVHLAETGSAKQTLVQQSLAHALDLKELTGSLDKPCGSCRMGHCERPGINSIPVRQLSPRSSTAG